MVQELVPPSVYETQGTNALRLIDDRVLMTLDQLRIQFGPCTVNDWCFGGSYTQSGLRTEESEYYSPTSQHSFGRAMDCKFRDCSADAVREFIIHNKSAFPFIVFIETDISWFHFDVRNGERITFWSPETGKSRIL